MVNKTKPLQRTKQRVTAAKRLKSAGAVTKRRKQKRALDTRSVIIMAALAEFAEKGFEAASIRSIGDRTGFQHPLITYHFKTKDILWQAVAEHTFAEIRAIRDAATTATTDLTAVDRLKEEYKAFLRFTLDFPDFHHFMLHESRPGNPRLPWLTTTMINPLLNRLVPEIREAQAAGDLPLANPILIHYLLIGATSVLSSLGAEIREATGISPTSPAVVETYWALIEQSIFGGFDRFKQR